MIWPMPEHCLAIGETKKRLSNFWRPVVKPLQPLPITQLQLEMASALACSAELFPPLKLWHLSLFVHYPRCFPDSETVLDQLGHWLRGRSIAITENASLLLINNVRRHHNDQLILKSC